MRITPVGLLAIAALSAPWQVAGQEAHARGVELADLTWVEAEVVLTSDAVVILPLGAQSKEHGPHLRLDNDFRMAEYLKRRVLGAAEVVMAPTFNYHYYPSFLEYPGSTHLTALTARDVVADVVRSLAGYGPRRFYIINTGVSTLRPLQESAEALAQEGIILHFTNILEVAGEAEESVREQARGTHADEIETSMMLYIAPDRVDMERAIREDNPSGKRRGLTRDPEGSGTFSASGIWGDPTLATVEKGRLIVEATVAGILADIEALRALSVPGEGPDVGEADRVRAALESYYDVFSERDWQGFAAHFWEGATITTVWAPPGEEGERVVATSIPDFVSQAPQGPGSREIFEERMERADIRVQGGLAQAWVTYRARFGDPGEIMEWEGVDVFSLLRHDGEWRITSLTFMPDAE